MAALLALCCAVALALPGVALGAPTAHTSVGFEPGPLSLATDPAGDVYLSNPEGSRQIQKFSPAGVLLESWGDFRADASNFTSARELAVNGAGEVFVADNSAAGSASSAPLARRCATGTGPTVTSPWTRRATSMRSKVPASSNWTRAGRR
jgi:DNA-binding beta-propeller fold protein YncE